MRNQPKSSLLLLAMLAPHMSVGAEKISVTGGFFSINAKAGGQSSSISNPSAFHVGYRKTFTDELEFKIGYSVLMADFSGTDLGYGVDVGANYYPFSAAADGKYRDERITVNTYEQWRPFFGLAFNQRSFQSIRNSYAGLGFSAGTERYHNEKFNWVAEVKYISLAGSNESEATEMQAMVGMVFKI